MTGQNGAAVNVAGGQTLCLDNLDQTGEVTVDPGGTLSIRGSTITGAVSLFSGFSEFEFCDSTTVGGAISATGGTGPVTIGDTGVAGTGLLGCDADTIDGAVTLDANKSDVTLARSEIQEAVTASANTGDTKIAGNHIVGALSCDGNAPHPNNIGLLDLLPMPNTVDGARAGETCLSDAF